MRRKSTELVLYIHKILQQQNFFALYQPWIGTQKHCLVELKNRDLDYYRAKDQLSLRIPGLNLVIYEKKEQSFEVFLTKLQSLSTAEGFILLGIYQKGNTYSPHMLKYLPVERKFFSKNLQKLNLVVSRDFRLLEMKPLLCFHHSSRSLINLFLLNKAR